MGPLLASLVVRALDHTAEHTGPGSCVLRWSTHTTRFCLQPNVSTMLRVQVVNLWDDSEFALTIVTFTTPPHALRCSAIL